MTAGWSLHKNNSTPMEITLMSTKISVGLTKKAGLSTQLDERPTCEGYSL